MAFASPSASSRNICSISDTNLSGTKTYLFNIPQDSDEIVARFYTGSFVPQSTNAAQVTIQTSEDGGTTWRDVAAWTCQATIGIQSAHFQPISCANYGNGRGIANWVGSVAASTLALAATASVATGVVSGLPMIGTLGRVQVTYTGTITTNTGVNVDIFAPTTQLR